MIERVVVKSEASFGPDEQVLDGLAKYNFIFGTNGSGKTTISRIVANASDYPHCSVVWQGGQPLKTIVYNRDFVERSFDQSPQLKGIFTLGEESKEVTEKIATAKSELDELADEVKKLTATLKGEGERGGKEVELKQLESEFEEECWAIKQKLDADFQGAFVGVRNSKEAFKQRMLREAESNNADLKSIDDLKARASSIFDANHDKVAEVESIKFESLTNLEGAAILRKKVIGSSDVDIADLIQRLGNSDWVKQGLAFYDPEEGTCPFCQQATPDSFAASLNKYFDETFESDLNEINRSRTVYAESVSFCQQYFERILQSPAKFLDVEKLRTLIELFQAKTTSNQQHLKRKQVEPSLVITLEPLGELCSQIEALVEVANTNIRQHNRMVDNLAEEKQVLTNEVWRYVLDQEIDVPLALFLKKRVGLTTAIENLNIQIDNKEARRRAKQSEIRELEKVTTSIQPTVDGVNSILQSFGFRNFQLAQVKQSRFYKIVRNDGSDAKTTLSEGERNFVAFLYFYHLLKGSESESGMTTDRVIVFDDPVSSFDSDVLFIVSALIRGLMEDMRSGNSHVKQVFVLTHNVYFHREVTFNQRRPNGGKLREETFWTVRKLEVGSTCESHGDNPIKTSYECLWMELKRGPVGSITIQNTMRRILEGYFTVLGNLDRDAICEHFEGREKLVCQSLFSWVNAGSHITGDDIFVSVDGTSVETYLSVFKQIFIRTQHGAHYEMMMGDTASEGTP
ncbi:AAA family ATPase [Planctomycetales bacterium ZRK34]|nr:AAA family ATPase [Planctomycetales bacterium ZRK34]